MRRISSIGKVLVVFSLLASSAAFAGWGGGRGGKGGGHGGMGPNMFQQLNLTAQQKQQLEQLHAQFAESARPVKEQLRQKHQQMMTLWQAPNPDRAAILALHVEMDKLRAQLREAHVDLRLACLQLLTPEQRTKMNELMQKGPHKGKPHGGPGMGGGCPFQEGTPDDL